MIPSVRHDDGMGSNRPVYRPEHPPHHESRLHKKVPSTFRRKKLNIFGSRGTGVDQRGLKQGWYDFPEWREELGEFWPAIRTNDYEDSTDLHVSHKPQGLPLHIAARYGQQLLCALRYLKSLGYVHTDFKSDNIFWQLGPRSAIVRRENQGAVVVSGRPGGAGGGAARGASAVSKAKAKASAGAKLPQGLGGAAGGSGGFGAAVKKTGAAGKKSKLEAPVWDKVGVLFVKNYFCT